MAIASLVLGIASIAGMCLTGMPAYVLGMRALDDIRRERPAKTLGGRGMAITGAALGGLMGLLMFALPLLLIIPIERQRAREREHAERIERVLADVRTGGWKDAAAEYDMIIEMDSTELMHWLRASPLHARTGDSTRYRQFCERALAQFGDTRTPHVAEKLSKACLLLPTSDSVLDQVAKLTEVATRNPNDWAILYSYFTHGLARYRQGSYREAIEACESCLSGDAVGEVWFRRADAFLVQAMAYSELGHAGEAAEALRRGRELIDGHPLELGIIWHDELISRILLDEAEATLAAAEG